MYEFMRNIETIEASIYFLNNVLNLSSDNSGFEQIALEFLYAEQNFRKNFFKSTFADPEFRDPNYSDLYSRLSLRKKIFDELTTTKQINNEEDICLGAGGFLPPKSLIFNKKASYIIGLPSSGKSTLAKHYSDIYSAAILDCDYAKRKLPEYTTINGACLTHKESRYIVWGENYHDEKSIFNHFVKKGANIILTKIGNEKNDVIENIKILLASGYKISFFLCRIRRQTSVIRSFDRFIKTGRYISLPMIFDWYADTPTLVFHEITSENNCFVDVEIFNND